MSRWLAVLLLAGACGDNQSGKRDGGVAFDAGPDAMTAPDLVINRARAEVDLAIGQRDFAADACELDPDEDCVGGPGLRTLLWFSVETPNLGTADMVLGQPTPENDQFEFSQCHSHFHFNGYAYYEILDAAGTAVSIGRKQAFCLLDVERFVTDDDTVATAKRFNCGFQGIQRGWSDVYRSDLPCQFIDVTDLTPGPYRLRVELNRDRLLTELDYENNILEIPLDLTDAALATPTEACTSTGAHETATLNRECGWGQSQTFACTPGQAVNVGCNQDCGAFSIGSCTGDPQLRVCDATRADGNCSFPSALGSNNDSCSSVCPAIYDLECPPSGQLEVFVGARDLGAPFTCNLELQSP